VKFIKQKIKAAQSERNRLSMLLAEYTNDIVASQSDRAVKSRKDSLWSLVTKLLSAFNHSNPATYYLFEDAPEISENGIKNILSFYEMGKLRFQKVLDQDVYKIEPRVASGRHAADVSIHTYTQLENVKKQKSKSGNVVQESTIQQNTLALLSEISLPKQTRRITTEAEKTILAQLFDYEENLPETAVTKVFWELQPVSLDWTTERIKMY
ncbi:3434_t:CDS:1, partial [Racocetra fulgida]